MPHSFARVMARPDSRKVLLEKMVDVKTGPGHGPAGPLMLRGRMTRWPSLAYPTDDTAPRPHTRSLGYLSTFMMTTWLPIHIEPAWRTQA